jgi:polyisoprenoid-binding protein YceI
MKLKITLLFLGLTFFFGVGFSQTKLSLNKQNSIIQWTGKKLLGQHTGTVNISDGQLLFNGSTLSGGNFTIDMTSIKNTDLKDEGMNQKLVGHLKSPDFFNVSEFNTASFKITKIEKYKTAGKYKITGDLMIKGITNPVTFDASIGGKGSKYSGTADIILDRSKWEVKYGSTSFFDGLGDKAISNNIDLKVSIETN